MVARSKCATTNTNDGMTGVKCSVKSARPWTHGDEVLQEMQWQRCMESIPRCEAATGIREGSVYTVNYRCSKERGRISPTTHSSCMKPLFREYRRLRKMLPCQMNSGIWLRFDEDTPQFARAMMAAPENTPYAGGLFVFDIYVPNNYPMKSPRMTLLTTGRGSVRFGPNLYADGTVCLSLLGSWNGPQWDPLSSNLYQLLVSVQSLILGVEQPYYLEPGRGGWEGTVRSAHNKDGVSMIEVERWKRGTVVKMLPWHVRRYNSFLTSATAQWAMLDHLRQPTCNGTEAFRDVIHAHFYASGEATCERLNRLCDSAPWTARTQRLVKLKKKVLPELEDCISSIARPKHLHEGYATAA